MQDLGFKSRFLYELLRDFHSFQEHNTDYAIFSAPRRDRLKRRAKDKALALLAARGFVRRAPDVSAQAAALLSVVERLDGLERTYHLLADEHSRRTLLDVLRYRVLGHRHVRLARNSPEFWDEYESVDRRFLRERRTLEGFWGWDFNLYEPEKGLRLHGNLPGVLETFRLEQYAYRRGDLTLRADEGDVVVDGGAFTGDTALYFAARVGAGGRVYAFEFDARNLDIMGENLALNPHLAPRVRVVERAMWRESDAALDYDPNGPATTVALHGESGAAQATTLSIDGLVERENLERVDFVKMDIEGAELAALEGAEATLRAFRPKLAISVYHREGDLADIPAYLDDLHLGYRFYLDHFTIYGAETVLFAVAT